MIAELIQKLSVVGFEGSDAYWRLSSSTRYWDEQAAACAAEGIEMIPRVSFATLPLGDRAVAVAFDFGHLFRTELTVGDYFDPALASGERGRRRRDFDRLRVREARKGTLLYDNGNGMIKKCYFHDYPDGTTCDGTGTVKVADKVYRSLFDYYRQVYPGLPVAPNDLVAHVSFPGLNLGRAVPVAAKLLRLRVMLDKSPCFLKAFWNYFRARSVDEFYLPRHTQLASRHPVTWLRVRVLLDRAKKLGLTGLADEVEEGWHATAKALAVREEYEGMWMEDFFVPLRSTLDDMLEESQPRRFSDADFKPYAQTRSLLALLDEAWQAFESNPTTYRAWEKGMIETLLR